MLGASTPGLGCPDPRFGAATVLRGRLVPPTWLLDEVGGRNRPPGAAGAPNLPAVDREHCWDASYSQQWIGAKVARLSLAVGLLLVVLELLADDA